MNKTLRFLGSPDNTPCQIHCLSFLTDVDLNKVRAVSKRCCANASQALYFPWKWQARYLVWNGQSFLVIKGAVETLNAKMIERVPAHIQEQALKVREPANRWYCLRSLIKKEFAEGLTGVRLKLHELIGAFLIQKNDAAVFLLASANVNNLNAHGWRIDGSKNYLTWSIHHNLKTIFNILINHNYSWDESCIKKAVAMWKTEPDYLAQLIGLPLLDPNHAALRSLWVWTHAAQAADKDGDLSLIEHLKKLPFPAPGTLNLAYSIDITHVIDQLKRPEVQMKMLEAMMTNLEL